MTQEKRQVTFGGNPVTLMGESRAEGSKAPDFTVIDKELKPVRFYDVVSSPCIISVVPSVDTGVCSAQTRRFNQEAVSLKDLVVLTISMDLPFALNRFCAAEGIDHVYTFSDHREADFGMTYGFLIKELRLLARGVILVDSRRIIRHIQYVPEIGHHPDYEAVLKAARGAV
ncbi:MAG TPA: thiol peroxidase [Candidatus Mcinerneyibacteriales bacterium]|nr:thiol peroxidase [Candidatus Mcinerneyibacteriales bacterium]